LISIVGPEKFGLFLFFGGVFFDWILFANLLRRKTYTSFLFFVTTAGTATTGAFEFPSLGADQRLDMGSGFFFSMGIMDIILVASFFVPFFIQG